ncbi:MAG: (2Fe-2S)-binding protein, partial [Oscillospiraceae bacterium]|nr:(2Fe-2S)-binding protein [Oscillospiraceae bacterium]
MSIQLKINGVLCQGREGDTILDVARANGIEIPTLCHDDRTEYYGACGVCVVEAAHTPKLLRACSTLAAEGMEITVHGARADKVRKVALE